VRLEVHLDNEALRRWHLDLLRVLERQSDIAVTVRWSAGGSCRTSELIDRLLGLERTINRLPHGSSSREGARAFERYVSFGAIPDLILDLTDEPPTGDIRTWRLTFDGSASETAALAALLSGRMPTVQIVDAPSGKAVATGRPGSETPGVVVAAFEDVLARCIDLVLLALDGGNATRMPVGPQGQVTRGELVKYGGKAVARAAAHRIYRLLYRSPHWRVGWRFVDTPDVIDLLGHPSSGWHDLPDDGYHFYADPFPIVAGDDTYLFVEDFDHRVRRAGISVVAFDEFGPVGSPRPVLEHESHLSYPFVLEDEGQFWMIPESSAAETVELYRAVRFPDHWELEEILLEGIEACDATPFRSGGRWWLSATVRNGGSSSDALHLWSSDRLQGPWRPHVRNPVLVDIGSARPAGRVVARDRRLIRPVQDGRGGYGAALGLAEITRLNDDAFEQTVLAKIGPGPQWAGRRLHTLNRAGRLECIDGSAFSSRFRRGSATSPMGGAHPGALRRPAGSGPRR
jgi:hypothetical protein